MATLSGVLGVHADLTRACLTRAGKLHLPEILDLLGSETSNWPLGLFCRWRSLGLRACMGLPVIWASASPRDRILKKQDPW